jgi:hypothetical protein
MITDKGRSNVDRLREQFNTRLVSGGVAVGRVRAVWRVQVACARRGGVRGRAPFPATRVSS